MSIGNLSGAANDLMGSGLGDSLKTQLLEEEEERKKRLAQMAKGAGSFGAGTQALFGGAANPAAAAF